MKLRHIAIAVGVAAGVAAGATAVYRAGVDHGSRQAGAPLAGDAASGVPASGGDDPTSSIAAGEAATRRHITQGLKAGQVDPVNGRAILYYHDPMVPGKRFDAPAKSPFMEMMLVPVYAGAGADDRGGISVSPRVQQNLGVRTAEVVEGRLQSTVDVVGSIAWNERDQSVVQARAAGYVEKLHVRATLDRVEQGQPFVDLYVPEWVAVQEEYLALRRFAAGDAALIAAARQRLLLAGMTEDQVARVDEAGAVRPRITLTAPSSGVVAELVAREGMTVMPGTLLARINGLSSVWALAELPESQAGRARPGTVVEARIPGDAGAVFKGRVQALLPEVDAATRTIRARVQLANPGGRLVPGLFVTMRFADTGGARHLLVPTEAVIQTGRRAVVLLAEDGGRFTPVDVDTGAESGGRTEIRGGLRAGQRVVVSSQFLIDSEASLRGFESRLKAPAPAGSAPPADAPRAGSGDTARSAAQPAAPTAASDSARHRGEGRVESIDGDSVTLSHGPIATLGMGAMTMEFKLPAAARGAVPPATGDRVDFEFVVDPNDGPVVTRLTALPKKPASGGTR